MPYFLRIDPDGIAQIGGEYDAAPSDDWKPGIVANYLQRWDGSAWQDTAQAEALRVAQAADAVAIPAAQAAIEKNIAKTLVTSTNPVARASRTAIGLVRKIFREKINEIITAGKSGDWNNVALMPDLTDEQIVAMMNAALELSGTELSNVTSGP